MLAWSNKLELGIDIIDNQHKEIFEEIIKLEDSFNEGSEQDKAYEMLLFIEEYVKKHFSMEEFYLKKYNYNGLIAHARLHKEFSDKLMEYKASWRQAGITKKAAIEMKNLLLQWWNNHILKVDSQYADWLIPRIKREKYESR